MPSSNCKNVIILYVWSVILMSMTITIEVQMLCSIKRLSHCYGNHIYFVLTWLSSSCRILRSSVNSWEHCGRFNVDFKLASSQTINLRSNAMSLINLLRFTVYYLCKYFKIMRFSWLHIHGRSKQLQHWHQWYKWT